MPDGRVQIRIREDAQGRIAERWELQDGAWTKTGETREFMLDTDSLDGPLTRYVAKTWERVVDA